MRAYARFAFKLLVFLAPLAAVLGWFERRLPAPPIFAAKAELLRHPPAGTRIVVAGSSHEFGGVDPRCFRARGVNLAQDSQDIFYDCAVVERALDVMPEVSLVLVGVSYHSLGSRLADSTEKFRCFWYRSALGLPLEPGASPLDPRAWSRFALYGNLASIVIARHDFPAPVMPLALGFRPMGPLQSRRDLDQIARTRAQGHTAMLRPDALEANVASLAALFAKLRERHVAAAMITLPVTPEYRRALDATLLATNRERIAALSSATGVPAFDMLDDPSLGLEDFADADHLSALGAEKVSARIDREIVARFLR